MSGASFAIPRPPAPFNEPIHDYAPGSPERARLKGVLAQMAGEVIDIPMVIGGEEVTSGDLTDVVMPHDRKHVIGRLHVGEPKHMEQAIEAANEAHHDWARMPFEERAGIILRAAELLSGPWRDVLNASTMLGQSKTVHQAEIDAACELIDFWRFNVEFMFRIYEEQPVSGPGMWNQMDYRPLEGFVFAVSPFNFTSIQANLPTAPALMGCTTVWKPSPTATHSAHFIMKLLEAAGMPPGVVNMVHGPGPGLGEVALEHPDLAGIHFTGSTGTFQWMWEQVGKNIGRYKTFPRLVGETGGKDFIVAHPSTSADALSAAILRGAFEYQGQKCSAASRLYVPESLWGDVRDRLVDEIPKIKMGDVTDFENFMGAVIDARAFSKHADALDEAKSSKDMEIVAGGKADDSEGFFVQPTVIQAKSPDARLMRDELFGPIVTAYVYKDKEWSDMLDVVDRTAPFALTGAVFSDDKAAAIEAKERLRYTAGNFYVNDKPTGAVVGQQPFGGARSSGTNDKAGSLWNLARWTSPRTIKETFSPPTDYRYPYMQPDQGV